MFQHHPRPGPTGAMRYQEEQLRQVAALTARNTNSDVRIRPQEPLLRRHRSLLSVEEAFSVPVKTSWWTLSATSMTKVCLFWRAAPHTERVRQGDLPMLRRSGSPWRNPVFVMHFYNSLSHLQSCGFILLMLPRWPRPIRTHPAAFRPAIEADTIANDLHSFFVLCLAQSVEFMRGEEESHCIFLLFLLSFIFYIERKEGRKRGARKGAAEQ